MKNRIQQSLSNLPASLSRWPQRRWIIAGCGGIAFASMMTAFALTPDSGKDVNLETVLEQLAPTTTTLVSEENDSYLREEAIRSSDTLSSLTARLGISDKESLSFIKNDPDCSQISRQLRPGKTVTAKTNANGELMALHFPLNEKDSMLVVEKSNTGLHASKQTISAETRVVIKSGKIQSSLFETTDAVGIPDSIAIQLAEIFSADIDFHRDLRKGDQFSLVYETLQHQGQVVRSGRILSAEFTNNNKTYSAFWFQTNDGKGAYYTADGKTLRKAFLRSPLEFSRITSSFSNARLHPVLNIVRAHKGIDYGAPTGTKVRSVADASVEFVGRQGGYGNLIILKHQGDYSTAYGHLSAFAPGLKKGSRVSQGDTIGYVGQTGLASGPHLHYEFRVHSQQVNPLAIDLPTALPLQAAETTNFMKATAPLKEQIKLAKQIDFTSVE